MALRMVCGLCLNCDFAMIVFGAMQIDTRSNLPVKCKVL